MSRCLQVDVGNSSAKWRLLEHGAVVDRGRYLLAAGDSPGSLPDVSLELDKILVASVAGPAAEAELAALCQRRWGVAPLFARTSAETAGLRNSYLDPSRMGVDRWLAMLGARQQIRGRFCVVDAGSALTIDLVAADGQHEGGYIIPGPALMERALLLDTDRVRFDEEVGYGLEPGKSTAEAVRHGIALAQAGAVSLVLDRCQAEEPQLFFAGGAGEMLMTLLGRGGSYHQDLVFEGLEAAVSFAPESLESGA